MLNGGGEKIKWKLVMIYNARKNPESGLSGDKLTFLNLIYQGWDTDVLFWCIIMGGQVSEMRGELLKYAAKKKRHMYISLSQFTLVHVGLRKHAVGAC